MCVDLVVCTWRNL